MKTTKEYPATHSMSTAWFYADENGEVAIIEFEDNGPVPENISNTQTCISEFLFDTFTEKDTSIPVRKLNLTDNQALEFYDKSYKKGEPTDLLCYSVVKINPENENVFFQEIVSKNNEKEVTCLSRNLGLYYIDFIENPSNLLLKTLEDIRIIDYYIPSNYETYINFDDMEFRKVPFYVYKQSYSRKLPIARVVKPEYPVKVSQLPAKAQNEILKLPIKFSETDTLQIADYYISDWAKWADDDFEFFSFNISPEEQLKFDYYKLSDGKGAFAYYLNCLPLSKREPFYINQCAYYCTVLILEYSGSPKAEIDYKKGNFAAMSAFSDDELSIKLFWREKKDYITQLSEKERIKRFQKNPIEKVIKFLNPYLLIIDDEVMLIVEKFFAVSNHEIEICGQKFPFYLFSEIEAHHDEIMDYANREYRGMKIPIKLTEKEVEELIYNEKSLDNEIQKSKTSVDRPF